VVLAQCGAGKVNAAMATTLLLEHFRPARGLMTGTAGGLGAGLRPGDIIIGAKTAYHDFGDLTAEGFRAVPTRNPLTQKRNTVYFPADEKLLALAQQAASNVASKLEGNGRVPSIKAGTIVTGDIFVLSSNGRL
jgi:adenosylhomocysteine nucleosidase